MNFYFDVIFEVVHIKSQEYDIHLWEFQLVLDEVIEVKVDQVEGHVGVLWNRIWVCGDKSLWWTQNTTTSDWLTVALFARGCPKSQTVVCSPLACQAPLIAIQTWAWSSVATQILPIIYWADLTLAIDKVGIGIGIASSTYSWARTLQAVRNGATVLTRVSRWRDEICVAWCVAA